MNAGIRAGSNTVGFGNRAGAPNYYCQPGVCQKTGRNDPDYRVCLGGVGSQNAAGAANSDGVSAERTEADSSLDAEAGLGLD